MAELMFACPNTNRTIASGITVPAADFANRPAQRILSQCPDCKMVHGWMSDEGWLKVTEAEIAEACKEPNGPKITKKSAKQTDAEVSQWVVDL